MVSTPLINNHQIGNLPQKGEEHIKYLKPPPRLVSGRVLCTFKVFQVRWRLQKDLTFFGGKRKNVDIFDWRSNDVQNLNKETLKLCKSWNQIQITTSHRILWTAPGNRRGGRILSPFGNWKVQAVGFRFMSGKGFPRYAKGYNDSNKTTTLWYFTSHESHLNILNPKKSASYVLIDLLVLWRTFWQTMPSSRKPVRRSCSSRNDPENKTIVHWDVKTE